MHFIDTQIKCIVTKRNEARSILGIFRQNRVVGIMGYFKQDWTIILRFSLNLNVFLGFEAVNQKIVTLISTLTLLHIWTTYYTQFLELLWWRANAKNVSFSISLRQQIHRLVNAVDHDKMFVFHYSTHAVPQFLLTDFLTIILRARMGSKSIAHETEDRMGYWLRGERNKCFRWSKISRQNNLSWQNAIQLPLFWFQSRRFSLLCWL